MVKRRRMNRSTAELRAQLDVLREGDPDGYDLGYLLLHDFLRVQNGHWKSMKGGPAERAFDRASPGLQERGRQMFRILASIMTTEFEQDQPSPPQRPASPSPRAPATKKATKRRYWRRKKAR